VQLSTSKFSVIRSQIDRSRHRGFRCDSDSGAAEQLRLPPDNACSTSRLLRLPGNPANFLEAGSFGSDRPICLNSEC
jgi:hypothetical protein